MSFATGDRLPPPQVRAATFDKRWRGLHPDQVRDYLDRVADELERLHRELITANTETERIRRALRQWQARHISRRCGPTTPDNRGPR
ncbi:DivIVA domain-containing protein [Micromonospora ureilytica]|uniref:DivIVA domain-containing protein n=1 Tax=Micromonospora ureilytica TaxID=709868 RepID=UPI002E151C5D|nr:DivIVA domain-containing protein [Micromonospora ureilytica]